MGLDQYAFATRDGNDREIAYWRKHPNLQGWMENLWESKGRPGWCGESNPMGDFNCVRLALTAEDIDALEAAIDNDDLPETAGFFFGDPKDGYYREQDLQFIKDARAAISDGEQVSYDSWW